MQGLVKAQTRIKKFIPHSGATGANQNHVLAGHSMPMLKPEGFDQLAHDTRNILSALRLYCDLLAEPGVLTETHSHYATELQAISDTAVRLVEGLAAPRRAGSRRAARAVKNPGSILEESASGEAAENSAPPELNGAAYKASPWKGDVGEGEVADDLGRQLLCARPLLAAIAGPGIELEIESLPCEGRTRLSREDLIRVLLNLVRNASEAMPEGGKLRITAQYGDGLSFLHSGQIPDARPRSVVIAVQDSGPGIPEGLRELIFSAGFTTRETVQNWPGVQHRGLGLSIVCGLIAAAGGKVCVSSGSTRGARFELELPITYGTYEITGTPALVADSGAKGCIECQ